mgnify:CR=1 FL=1
MLKRFMPLLVAACVGAGAYHYFTNEVIQANDWQYYLETDLITQLKDRKDACKGLFHIPFTNIRVGTNETSCSMFAALSKDQQGVVQLAESPKPPTVLAALWAQSQHQPSSQLVAVGSKAEGGSDCDLSAIRGRVDRSMRPYFDRYKQLVCSSAYSNGLNPIFLAAQINQESGFYPWARSKSKDKKTGKIIIVAEGIAQITKPTARSWGVRNVYNPYEAIPAMAKHMASYKRTYQRQGHSSDTAHMYALAAYNAGPHRVAQYGGVPPYKETRNYVARIWQAFKRKV